MAPRTSLCFVCRPTGGAAASRGARGRLTGPTVASANGAAGTSTHKPTCVAPSAPPVGRAAKRDTLLQCAVSPPALVRPPSVPPLHRFLTPPVAPRHGEGSPPSLDGESSASSQTSTST